MARVIPMVGGVGGGVKDDTGVGGNTSGDLGIEIGLYGIAIFARVGAIYHDLCGFGAQSEGGAIVGVLGYVDIGVANDTDGDAGAAYRPCRRD